MCKEEKSLLFSFLGSINLLVPFYLLLKISKFNLMPNFKNYIK